MRRAGSTGRGESTSHTRKGDITMSIPEKRRYRSGKDLRTLSPSLRRWNSWTRTRLPCPHFFPALSSKARRESISIRLRTTDGAATPSSAGGDDKGKTKGQLLHDDKTTSSGLSSSSWRNWRNGMTTCARRRDDPGGAGRWHSTTSPS